MKERDEVEEGRKREDVFFLRRPFAWPLAGLLWDRVVSLDEPRGAKRIDLELASERSNASAALHFGMTVGLGSIKECDRDISQSCGNSDIDGVACL